MQVGSGAASGVVGKEGLRPALQRNKAGKAQVPSSCISMQVSAGKGISEAGIDLRRAGSQDYRDESWKLRHGT